MATLTRRLRESVTRTPRTIPTLSQMIREGAESAARIKQASKEALLEWFKQSERLDIARTHYKLRGRRFADFASRIGVDRASAYQLVKLWQHRAAILSRCAEKGRYYGWETCLYWHEQPPRQADRGRVSARQLRHANKRIAELEQRIAEQQPEDSLPPNPDAGRYCVIPPALYRELDSEFDFTCDPCPHPLPEGFDGLSMDWGKVNYVNPPFRREDALNGRAITDFAKKAIEEQREGNTSVLLLPTVAVINLLLEAGAEMRPLGRVAWLHADTGEAWRSPHNVTAFILRGRKRVPSKRPAP